MFKLYVSTLPAALVLLLPREFSWIIATDKLGRRRGCAVVCPDGDLSCMQGKRLVLASTEQLHDRVSPAICLSPLVL